MKGDARGFTLVEILAALVVFGFIAAGLAAGIRMGLLAWRVQTETVSRDADLDTADRVLARLLTGIEPVGVGDAPSVIGTAAELAFTTSLPVRIGDPPTPFADARLLVRDGRLALELAPHYHAILAGRPPAPRTSFLADGVDHLQIAYWLRSKGQWQTTWRAQAPPDLVRVSVAFKDARRHWPPIVAAPHLSRYNQ